MRTKARDEDHIPCEATAKAWKTWHVHNCIGNHEENKPHFCGECREWWFRR